MAAGGQSFSFSRNAFMSDAYFASNFMGYSFFQSAYTARYEAGGGFTLFIMHGKAGEAENMLEKYRSR